VSAISVALVACGLALTVAGVEAISWLLPAGLLALLVLPVLRLATVIQQLARGGEWRFVWLGVIVLLLLAISLVWPAG
jgi:hypothetical protein